MVKQLFHFQALKTHASDVVSGHSFISIHYFIQCIHVEIGPQYRIKNDEPLRVNRVVNAQVKLQFRSPSGFKRT